ncbi:MAG TPA: MFS transporter [Chloroflexota bacterium]|jgi:EmrB/QacA subfamily drug resistance transporter|nr:MFS transporter [Chloroflexota bacterium]
MPRATPAVLTFTTLLVAVFVGALDQTVVVTALPAVIDELQIPFNRLNDAAWIVTAYLLGYTVAMPLIGRMSDAFGRQIIMVSCLALLGATSIACGAARSLEWLIVARGLQAIGGGALLPVTLAVVGDLFPMERRSILLGTVSGAAEAGGVLGPLWGAAVLDRLSWHWVFYFNVPIVLLLLLALRKWPAPGRTSSEPQRVDDLGGVLLGVGLGLLALGLSRETSQGGETRLLLGIGAVLALAAFVWQERRVVQPLIELRLFRQLPFAAGNALSLMSGVALIVAMVDVPLYAATVLQMTPVDGGLLLMRLMVGIPVGAVLGGWLTRRIGPTIGALIGVIACGIGLALLARWQADTSMTERTLDLMLTGLGFGIQLAPITTVVVGWAGAALAGVAAALVTVMRTIGMLVGVATLTSWGLERFNGLVAGLPLPLPVLGESAEVSQQRIAEYQQAVLNAALLVFSEIFLAAAIVCVLAVVPALLLRLAPRPAYG